ncbi:LptF/LptG family permease [Jejuia spongiicola]
MKILDRYILTTYLKTFLSVFIILMLIFVLQAIWLYIKELAGKDLDIDVILKFLLYVTPTLIPLILPLTILLSSIMVFGNFAENYEFAAMKSTGISLQRAMSGLSIFIVVVAMVTFVFSNNIIPWANYNFYNLRTNIKKTKPALAIAEGQFNQIGNYNIKVEEKSGDRGQYFRDVFIHIKGNNGKKNRTTIKSKTGELASEETSNVLKLILYDGNYYNDIPRKKPNEREKHPFAKSKFEKYTINIDLSQINTEVDFENKSHSDRFNMLNLSELDYTIDSLTQKRNKTHQDLSKNLYQRTNISRLKNINIKKHKKEPKNDSIYTGEILDLFETKNKSQLLDLALRNIKSTKQIIQSKKAEHKLSKINYNRHIVSFHEKLALGFACIILFFVGAPLGALIRKGGLGLPMVIAILLFLTYHFIGIFAINSAKSGDFNPVLASWFSTLVMLPLGVFLTKRATEDKGIAEGAGILEMLKKFFRLKKTVINQKEEIFNSNSSEYKDLQAYENNKLIDIIKNYREYSYSSKYRNTALSIINSRGISNQQLKFSGDFYNHKKEETIRLKNSFEEDSKLALILYLISNILTIPGAILENNKFPLLGSILIIIGLIVYVLFLFALIKSFISNSNFYKHIKKDSFSNALLFIIVGLPLYFFIYIYQKKRMEEELFIKEVSASKPNLVSEDVNINTEAKKSRKDYNAHSKFAIILYGIGVVLLVLFFVFKNNKMPSLQSASIQLSIVALFLFIIYYLKSILNLNNFYNHIDKKEKKPSIILLIIGLPLYMIVYPFLNVKIKEDLKQNCLDSLK